MDGNNKSNIVNCALELFCMKGYDGVGVQEICDQAGITKPTLYHYFGSKYGLLDYLLNDNFGRFRDALLEAFEYNRDLPWNLYRIAKKYFYYASRNRSFYTFFMSLVYSGEQSEPYKAVKPMRDEMFQMLADLFEQAGDVNGNLNGRQQQFSVTYLGSLNSYLLFWFDLHKDDEVEISDDQVFSIVHQFMHGIYV